MLNGPAPSLFAVHALLNWSAALANETTILTNNVSEILYKCFSCVVLRNHRMTSEFKETFSKNPSQNDSSNHDSLKLMPNLNAMPKRLSVHLFSFSLLVPSRITLKFKLQKSFL